MTACCLASRFLLAVSSAEGAGAGTLKEVASWAGTGGAQALGGGTGVRVGARGAGTGLGALSLVVAVAALAVANAATNETGGVLEAASHLVLLANL